MFVISNSMMEQNSQGHQNTPGRKVRRRCPAKTENDFIFYFQWLFSKFSLACALHFLMNHFKWENLFSWSYIKTLPFQATSISFLFTFFFLEDVMKFYWRLKIISKYELFVMKPIFVCYGLTSLVPPLNLKKLV